MNDKEEIIDNKRYRNWMILFYDESDHYKKDDLIFNLHGFKYYAYIKHKPETDEKSEHYHGIIHLDTATTQTALSKRLGLPANYISYVKNFRAGCRYLTHIDYPDKIQYTLDDVTCSGLFQRKFYKQFEDVKTEEEMIQDIYSWIDNFHYESYHLKLKYLIMYVNMSCYDTIFKRYRFEFIDYLKVNL